MPRVAPTVNLSIIHRRSSGIPYERRVREGHTPKFELSDHERQQLKDI